MKMDLFSLLALSINKLAKEALERLDKLDEVQVAYVEKRLAELIQTHKLDLGALQLALIWKLSEKDMSARVRRRLEKLHQIVINAVEQQEKLKRHSE